MVGIVLCFGEVVGIVRYFDFLGEVFGIDRYLRVDVWIVRCFLEVVGIVMCFGEVVGIAKCLVEVVGIVRYPGE